MTRRFNPLPAFIKDFFLSTGLVGRRGRGLVAKAGHVGGRELLLVLPHDFDDESKDEDVDKVPGDTFFVSTTSIEDPFE